MIVSPDALRRQSPFVLLVEDFIESQGDYHMHPHRGFVAVMLEGEMENVDHTGHSEIIGPGDVQWMNAGAGIFHGGKPHAGSTIHLLQLWLDLPDARRSGAPVTREQRVSAALEDGAPGAIIRTYGLSDPAAGADQWSAYPIRVVDLKLDAGATWTAAVPPAKTAFAYVLSGAATIADGRNVKAGEVVWLTLEDGERDLPVFAHSDLRMILYSGKPIQQNTLVHGPFVMGDEVSIRKAYADLQSGTLV